MPDSAIKTTTGRHSETEREREAAIWRLAEWLQEYQDRLDPDLGSWNGLTPTERDFYYFSVKAVLLQRDDVLRALEVDFAGNDVVDGSSNLREQPDVHMAGRHSSVVAPTSATETHSCRHSMQRAVPV